jgi:hypothetical protein
MLAVWRRSNRRIDRDSQTDWLIQQIRSAVPTSLGLATELFQYWASTRHGIVGDDDRRRVRQELVASARAELTSDDRLLKALGSAHDYPLTRLIFPPPTDEPPDSIPFEDWGWLVGTIIDAAVVALQSARGRAGQDRLNGAPLVATSPSAQTTKQNFFWGGPFPPPFLHCP